MRREWMCAVLFLCGVSAAQAQMVPNPYYQGYYPPAQPRFYYPQANGGHPWNAAPPNVYYAPGHQHLPYQSTSHGPTIYVNEQPQSVPTTIVGPAIEMPSIPVSRSTPIYTMPEVVPEPAAAPERSNLVVLMRRFYDSLAQAPEAAPIEEIETVPAARRHGHRSFWVTGEYVGMFLRPMRLQGALTTIGGLGNAFPGALGQPSTAVVYGNNQLDFNLASGFRVEAGVFLDPQNRFSLEWTGFIAFPVDQSFDIASDANGNPLIARPVFATDLNRQAAIVNSATGFFTGSVNFETKSDFAGTELNARCFGYLNDCFRIDGLFGIRYLRLGESLQANDTLTPIGIGAIFFDGKQFTSLIDQDTFETTNQFIGPQLGARATWDAKWVSLDVFGKLGLGGTLQRVEIAGQTTFMSDTGNVTANGGVLALPSNSGTFNRTVFGILPELGANLGINVCENVRVQFGYSVLMWNRVVRPGMQYDTNVNTGLIPGSPNFGMVAGPVAPNFRFNDEFFWTHYFNLGVQVRY